MEASSAHSGLLDERSGPHLTRPNNSPTCTRCDRAGTFQPHGQQPATKPSGARTRECSIQDEALSALTSNTSSPEEDATFLVRSASAARRAVMFDQGALWDAVHGQRDISAHAIYAESVTRVRRRLSVGRVMILRCWWVMQTSTFCGGLNKT